MDGEPKQRRLPSEDGGQKDVRLRDDAISAKHIGAAEDSRRPETSLAQQDFAMGRVPRRILSESLRFANSRNLEAPRVRP